MLRFLPLKLGRLYRCLKLLLVVGLFVILLMNTHSLFASFQKNELTDRRFINLNKCPACFGTSWCRKFMNGQVSFETWGRLRFLDVFNVKNVYFAQYGEPREGTRRVVLKRLGSNQELAEIDQKICKRATGRPRCDLIQAMYKTEFARINGDVRLLTPEVVEGWSDLVHCPSQRLLDRVVRRYAETKDSGSFLLKNLKDTERMQLLMTLAFNPEPLVLQVLVVDKAQLLDYLCYKEDTSISTHQARVLAHKAPSKLQGGKSSLSFLFHTSETSHYALPSTLGYTETTRPPCVVRIYEVALCAVAQVQVGKGFRLLPALQTVHSLNSMSDRHTYSLLSLVL
ncbi:hypothetical protein FQN60_013666 [Etheostoma spectabile]|uniref:FAM69 protein-kinase domain-containing protein n=1 Tax=Etheostoma spectabile TaxID=54343 RepID=A0A5J5CG78_9PERO|nr:hypothetical protein FQN60_013666 [Etheostoma spectabile]